VRLCGDVQDDLAVPVLTEPVIVGGHLDIGRRNAQSQSRRAEVDASVRSEICAMPV
jgi:hypothetical protein